MLVCARVFHTFGSIYIAYFDHMKCLSSSGQWEQKQNIQLHKEINQKSFWLSINVLYLGV